MPATVTLEDNGRILHFTFRDPVNFSELSAVEEQANFWYERAHSKIHTLLDVRHLRALPEGFMRFRKTNGLSHRNAGNTAVVGASVYVQAIGETIFRLARNDRTRFFPQERIADAWAYLRQIITVEKEAEQVEAQHALTSIPVADH